MAVGDDGGDEVDSDAAEEDKFMLPSASARSSTAGPAASSFAECFVSVVVSSGRHESTSNRTIIFMSNMSYRPQNSLSTFEMAYE